MEAINIELCTVPLPWVLRQEIELLTWPAPPLGATRSHSSILLFSSQKDAHLELCIQELSLDPEHMHILWRWLACNLKIPCIAPE